MTEKLKFSLCIKAIFSQLLFVQNFEAIGINESNDARSSVGKLFVHQDANQEVRLQTLAGTLVRDITLPESLCLPWSVIFLPSNCEGKSTI